MYPYVMKAIAIVGVVVFGYVTLFNHYQLYSLVSLILFILCLAYVVMGPEEE